MTQLQGKVAIVTGGSRGLGKGIVKSLAAAGAEVWAVARNPDSLAQLQGEIEGVQTLALDISEPDAATRVFEAAQPDIVVLNAGAAHHMAPLQEQTWEQFGASWNTDVKAAFHFGKAALLAPLASGSQVIVVSSGAAIGGSPLSGGYAGAKRMQWFLTEYCQTESDRLNLGIRFTALLPKQIIGSTELGHLASSGYAARLGITKEAFLERFGAPLTPDGVGAGVLALLTDEAYKEGLGFGITGSGLEKLN